jgi:hypothetical protein
MPPAVRLAEMVISADGAYLSSVADGLGLPAHIVADLGGWLLLAGGARVRPLCA